MNEEIKNEELGNIGDLNSPDHKFQSHRIESKQILKRDKDDIQFTFCNEKRDLENEFSQEYLNASPNTSLKVEKLAPRPLGSSVQLQNMSPSGINNNKKQSSSYLKIARDRPNYPQKIEYENALRVSSFEFDQGCDSEKSLQLNYPTSEKAQKGEQLQDRKEELKDESYKIEIGNPTTDSIQEVETIKVEKFKKDILELQDDHQRRKNQLRDVIGIISNVVVLIYLVLACFSDFKPEKLSLIITNIVISVITFIGQTGIMIGQSRLKIKWYVLRYIFQICGTTCLVADQSATINVFMALQTFVSFSFIILTENQTNCKVVLTCFHGVFGCTQILMNLYLTNYQLSPWVVLTCLIIIGVKTCLLHLNYQIQTRFEELLKSLDFSSDINLLRDKQKIIKVQQDQVKDDSSNNLHPMEIQGQITPVISHRAQIKSHSETKILNQLDLDKSKTARLDVEKMICQNFFASSLILKYNRQTKKSSLNLTELDFGLSQDKSSKSPLAQKQVSFEIVKMTKGFFDKLPDVSYQSEQRYSQRSRQGTQKNLNNKGLSASEPEHTIKRSSKNKSSRTVNRNRRDGLNPYLTQSAQMTYLQGNIRMDSYQNFDLDVEILNAKMKKKIYKPYFISNSTILHFQRFSNNSMSIIQILEYFADSQNRGLAKFYFKVDTRKEKNKMNANSNSSMQYKLGEFQSQRSQDAKANKQKVLSLGNYPGKRSQSNLQAQNGTGQENVPELMKKAKKRKVLHQINNSSSISYSHETDQINANSNNQNDEYETQISVHFDDYNERSRNMKSVDQYFKYFEFEIKIVEQFELSECSYTKNHPFQKSFKIGFDENLVMLNIREISNFVKNLQKTNDKIYLDAIEANYSHESMTPLNSIIANTKIVQKRLKALIQGQDNQQERSRSSKSRIGNTSKSASRSMSNHPSTKQLSSSKKVSSNSQISEQFMNNETMKLLFAIQKSGIVMRFYRESQILRMQIQRGQFSQNIKFVKSLDQYLKQLLDPFEPQITARQLNVYFSFRQPQGNFKMGQDWAQYQLILFNLLQNSIKYNKFGGDILISVVCKPHQKKKKIDSDQKSHQFEEYKQIFELPSSSGNSESQNSNGQTSSDYVLETQIIDTGMGISAERQKLLFIPMQELKHTQDFKIVKDYNIGLGLACSQSIAHAMKGDICIKQSERGLTVFATRMPIKIQEKNGSLNTSSFNLRQKQHTIINQLYGQSDNQISQNLIAYTRQELKMDQMHIVSKIDDNKSSLVAKTNQSKSEVENKSKSEIDDSGKNSSSRKNNSEHIMNRKEQKINILQFNQSNQKNYSEMRDVVQDNFWQRQRYLSQQNQNKFQKLKMANNLLFGDQSKHVSIEINNVSDVESITDIHLSSISDSVSSKSDKIPVAHPVQNDHFSIQLDRKKVSFDQIIRHQKNLNFNQKNIHRDIDYEIEEQKEPQYIGDEFNPYDLKQSQINGRSQECGFKQKMNLQGSQLNHDSNPLVQINPLSINSEKPSELNISDLLKSKSSKNMGPVQQIQEEKPKCNSQPKILVVDDQEFNIMTLKSMIQEKFKIEVDSVLNGKLAVEQYKKQLSVNCDCQNHIYKLILMDIQMPEMNGIEATKLILKSMRAYMKNHNIKKNLTHVVALTSYTNKSQECKDAGMSNLFNKPLKYKDLNKVIQLYHNGISVKEYKSIQKSLSKSMNKEQMDDGDSPDDAYDFEINQ